VRAVVHGHITIKNAQVLGNVHFIDTGGWMPGGCFTFLELETLKVVCGPTAPPTPGRINR
jgi:serine/threonine protein phosphatase 1